MKMIVLFFVCMTLSGCIAQKTDMGENKTIEVLVKHIEGNIIKENRDFFIGADITADTNVGTIADFEEKTEAHEVYAEEVYIDEAERAEDFILECYAADRKPYIIIKGRTDMGDADFKDNSEKMAQAIGKYNISAMVEILENSYYYDDSGEMYSYLSEKISKANPLVKTVWSVKADDVILAEKYMPDNADYICIDGYFSTGKEAKKMFSDIRSSFPAKKRIILRFGASGYSTRDCTYTPDSELDIIKGIYNKVCYDTQVCGVIYMDKNEKLNDNVIYTDYSLTNDRKVTNGYKEIINDVNAFRKKE